MGPVGSARRICAEEARPPRDSILEIAVADVSASRHRRKATCIGSLVASVGLARIALRVVPTDEELKPIFPTIPAYAPLASMHDIQRNDFQFTPR